MQVALVRLHHGLLPPSVAEAFAHRVRSCELRLEGGAASKICCATTKCGLTQLAFCCWHAMCAQRTLGHARLQERGMGQVTGDLHGAVARLQRELKQLKYPGEADEVG